MLRLEYSPADAAVGMHEMREVAHRLGEGALQPIAGREVEAAREVEASVCLIADVGASVLFVPPLARLMIQDPVEKDPTSLAKALVAGDLVGVQQRTGCGGEVVGEKAVGFIVSAEPIAGALHARNEALTRLGRERAIEKADCLAEIKGREGCRGEGALERIGLIEVALPPLDATPEFEALANPFEQLRVLVIGITRMVVRPDIAEHAQTLLETRSRKVHELPAPKSPIEAAGSRAESLAVEHADHTYQLGVNALFEWLGDLCAVHRSVPTVKPRLRQNRARRPRR